MTVKDITFANAGVVLAGSLSVPDRVLAGVVMVGGSGPSDRNNDTHFPAIRERLVDAGISVLSYGKRVSAGRPGTGLAVEVFPGADHRVRMDGGSLAPGYLDTLTRWIIGRVA